MIMVTTTVLFVGAKRPKLRKMMASQTTTMIRRGVGIEVSAWAKRSQRVLPRSVTVSSAWALSARCSSVCGASL